MIKVSAAIKIYENSEGAINKQDVNSEYVNARHNNVSQNISETTNVFNSTSNLFLLAKKVDGSAVGGSLLNVDSIYAPTSVPYYISKAMSGSTAETSEDGGGYAFPAYINIFIDTGEDNKLPANITIEFDKLSNSYATRVIIIQGGTSRTIINSSVILTIDDIDQNQSANIRILAWNKPNSPAVITSLYADLYYKIEGNRLIGCEFSLNEKGDSTKPCFGIVSNKGNIEFSDYDNTFLEAINQGRFDEKLQVIFYLNNTYYDTTVSVSQFVTESVSYDDDSKIVDIDIEDRLVELQDINGISILEHNKTMLEVYNMLKDLTPSYIQFAALGNQLQTYLSSIHLRYVPFQEGTLWSHWQKFCEATGLYMYINKQNEVMFAGEFDYIIEA